ncbi:MAG TPA: thiazole synthase [Burkholderiaceae bacterium]
MRLDLSAAAPSPWRVYGHRLDSRFLIGSAGYPSPDVLAQAIEASGAQVVTVGLKREIAGTANPHGGEAVALLRRVCAGTGARLLPNTAGCRSAREAVLLAQMSRELFDTPWIKLEVTGDDHTLQPDPFELVDAAAQLVRLGFQVFPYCTDDLVVCRRLLAAGCEVLMPWAAPIGSGQGVLDPAALRTLRARLPGVPLIVDAGLGAPSHAAFAMELGYDAVLLNSAIAQAVDPPQMAMAFAQAIAGGRLGYQAGLIAPQDMAIPSTPCGNEPILVE